MKHYNFLGRAGCSAPEGVLDPQFQHAGWGCAHASKHETLDGCPTGAAIRHCLPGAGIRFPSPYGFSPTRPPPPHRRASDRKFQQPLLRSDSFAAALTEPGKPVALWIPGLL